MSDIQHIAGRAGGWILRSINPLRMPAAIVSTFNTAGVERDLGWAKAGHAALFCSSSTERLPLIRDERGDIDEHASIQSLRRAAIAAHAEGHLSDKALEAF